MEHVTPCQGALDLGASRRATWNEVATCHAEHRGHQIIWALGNPRDQAQEREKKRARCEAVEREKSLQL